MTSGRNLCRQNALVMRISVCGSIWEFPEWEGRGHFPFNSFQTRARELRDSGSNIHFELFSFPARLRGVPHTHNTSRPALLRLSDYLLANYEKGVRPVRDWRKPTTVSIDVIVYAILSVVSAQPQSAGLRGGPFGVGDHVRPSHPLGSTVGVQVPTVPVVWHHGSGQTTAPTIHTDAHTRKLGSPVWLPLLHPCSQQVPHYKSFFTHCIMVTISLCKLCEGSDCPSHLHALGVLHRSWDTAGITKWWKN